jgi:hypothetical protein
MCSKGFYMARRKVSSGSGVHLSWPKPIWLQTVKTNKNFVNNYHSAIMYAHYELSSAELVKEILKYLKAKEPESSIIERIKHVNEDRVASYGKYMYVMNHGGDIPDDIKLKLLDALEKTLSEEETKVAAEIKAEHGSQTKDVSNKTNVITIIPAATIQDRIREKAKEVAGEVEGWIDDWTMDKKLPIKTVEEFVALFKQNDLKAVHMIHMRAAFQRRTVEFENVLKGDDAELLEAYSNFKRLEMKKLVMMMRNLFLACDMIQEVAKVARAPRKKKPVSIDKVVSKLKYKKEDSQLGIVSMNPVHIIGSKEVWVYNTKTRKLGVYKAVDAGGLTVKGSALLNYSPDSVEKTVRKPVETLAEFKKASKIKLRTFLKELTTVDVPCPGKLNENHVILRIDK